MQIDNENCARCMFFEFVGSYTYSYSPSPDFYGDQNRERLSDGEGMDVSDGRGDLGRGNG